MTIEALIFDVDGTLADTEEVHRQAFNAAFLEHGLWWNWGGHLYVDLLAVAGGKERIAHFVDTLDADAAEKARLKAMIPDLHRTKTAIYTQLVAAGRAPLRPGVERLVREARAAGMKLAIASTTTPVNVESLVSATLGDDALGWFAVIAAGDQVQAKKPAPDIYQLALDALGLPGSACVAFEDSQKGVSAAKSAGLCVVATPTFWSAGEDFSDADLVLPGLGDRDAPLDAVSAARVGSQQLGLEALRRLCDGAARLARSN